MYAAPESPKRTSVNVLEQVGDAPAAVTDGTFLPGGDRIALLTFFGRIEVLDASDYRKVAEVAAPAQDQAESLTVSLTGKSLLVGSEGKESVVYAVPIPSDGSSATPTASPSEDGDEPAPEEDAEAQSNAGESRARTLLALGLAGLVAVAAGSVVALAHKP